MKASSLFILTLLFSCIIHAEGISREQFENVTDFESLLCLYGEPTLNPELLQKIRSDWAEVTSKGTSSLKALPSLPAQKVSANGIEYRLYGFTHGNFHMLFTDLNGIYSDFIKSAYQSESDKIIASAQSNARREFPSSFIFTEQHINQLLNDSDPWMIDVRDQSFFDGYETKNLETVLEHYILIAKRAVAAFVIGLSTATSILSYAFNQLCLVAEGKTSLDYLWSKITTTENGKRYSVNELLTLHIFNTTKDSIDVEMAQSIANKLPTHLEAELLLANTKKETDIDENTKRSLYMAGFIKAFASTTELKETSLFMGSGHLAEVKGFLLAKEAQSTKSFKIGEEKGQQLALQILEAKESGDFDKLSLIISRHNPKGFINSQIVAISGYLGAILSIPLIYLFPQSALVLLLPSLNSH